MTLTLSQPRGFFAGVERAIESECALQKYLRHEIVRHTFVVDGLRAGEPIFSDVRPGAITIFSANGENSSNFNRLRVIGERAEAPSHVIADGSEVMAAARGRELPAGDVINILRRVRLAEVSTSHRREGHIEFRLPRKPAAA